MDIKKYWQLFRKHAHIWDFLLLILGFVLLGESVINIIKFLTDQSGVASVMRMGDVLWGGLGGLIIFEIFHQLEKKELTEQEKASNNPQNNNFSNEKITSYEPEKKTFSNYFPLILLIINIIFIIILWGNGIIKGNIGLEGMFLFIHLMLVFFAIPPTIFAFLGRFKKTANVFSCIFLLPPLLMTIVIMVTG